MNTLFVEKPLLYSPEMETRHLDPAYRVALMTCALLNLGMLFIEGGVGLWIGSAALLADAVDFLEDAAIFALSLVALRWSMGGRAIAGLFQGSAMAFVGIAAVLQIVYRILLGGAPSFVLMGGTAVLALLVNLYCAFRLVKFRVGDSSMRAIWLSSRNDAILNLLTVGAAGLIALTRSGWPDILAGAVIACVNLWASVEVLTQATRELRTSRIVSV